MRTATWNVDSMIGRGRELVDVILRRRVTIACVQETKWEGNCAKNLGCGYKLIYTGECASRNAVGVILNEEYSKRVTKVERYSDRLMKIQVVCNNKIWNIIAAYAPQVRRPQEEKEAFLEELEGVIERVPAVEKIAIGGDFNADLGEKNRDFKGEHGQQVMSRTGKCRRRRAHGNITSIWTVCGK